MAMSSTPTTAAPPDPVATAAAQAKMNKETAVAQTGLNAINQYSPEGSIEYSQGGTWADGTPRFSQTTTLSPEQRAIFDTNQVTQGNIANIGRDQSGRIGDLLGTPLKMGNEATEARIFDLGMGRLSPQFARDEEGLRTRLVNSGIREGSDAWNSEMERSGRSKTDAINQLLLSGRSLANQELLAERNAPINEITALMSGSQVSNPTMNATPQSQIAGVDYMGAVQNNYNNQIQQQKMQSDSNNAMMGGLFGMGGTLGGAALKYGGGAALFSDRRLKTDISRVGSLDNGLAVYAYRYKGETAFQIGLMADEVEGLHPEAVLTVGPHELKMVDYAKAVRG
jgi:hypothetical protein